MSAFSRFSCLKSSTSEFAFHLQFDLNFEQHQLACESVGAELAFVDNATEFSFIQGLYKKQRKFVGGNFYYYLGYQDINKTSSSNPARFEPLDSRANKSFYDTNSEEPWLYTHPLADGSLDCIQVCPLGLQVDSLTCNNHWFSIDCFDTLDVAGLCRRPCTVKPDSSLEKRVVISLFSIVSITMLLLIVLLCRNLHKLKRLEFQVANGNIVVAGIARAEIV